MSEKYAKLFWLTILGLVGFHIVSWLAYAYPEAQIWIGGVVLGLSLWAALRHPAWLAYASILELVVGGQGYLLFADVGGFELRLRMVLFLTTGLAALVTLFKSQSRSGPTWLLPAGAFLGWVGIMATVGLTKGVGFSQVLTDANGYLYLAMAWFWWQTLRTDTDWKDRTLTFILAGVTLVGIKSFVTMAIFSQQPAIVEDWYHWVRNTGTGEITNIQGDLWRIFFQSQVYSLIGFLLALAGFITKGAPRWWLWPLMFGALGIAISLSRSFWVGGGIGLLTLLAIIWKKIGFKALARTWILAPVAIVVWLMMQWAVQWPYIFPYPGDRGLNPVVARFEAPGTAQAADARREQLDPLWSEIVQRPVLGHGFGTSVTYYSPDPRINDFRTTSAFELGYLDQWLKFGLIGLALLGIMLGLLARQLRQTSWWMLFLPATVALLVTHAFSPYLNHPLGLGWIALLFVFAYDQD